jgi:hypothetical protein
MVLFPLALVLAFGLGGMTPAAAEATAGQIAAMKKVLNLCRASFGDAATLQATLKADGWWREPGSPVFRYRKAKEGLFAMHNRPSGKDKACGVSARGMTMEQARTLTLQTLKEIGGFTPHPTEERVWVGRLGSTKVVFGFTVAFDFQIADAPLIAFFNGLE